MYESWYREHYHEMSDAGRWFNGNGINVLSPAAWHGRIYRVLIVRLSTARDTADSFTHQLLYQIAVGCEGVFADITWLPPPEDGTLFDRDGIPWMTGVVTKRPATDFDCIAFSNSIVQEIINIPTLLRKSGIPPGKRARMARPDIPLVILGGANALFTSLLLGDDPPVDVLFAGEAAGLIGDIFASGHTAKLRGEGKGVLIQRLLDISGIIEPDCPRMTRKLQLPLNEQQQLKNAPVFPGEGNVGVGSLQISEGCACFCSFCAESWSRKPYREMTAEACMASAIAMKAAMGLERIELYSFNFNMHAQFKELIGNLIGLFPNIGLKSQRLDGIADDPELMKILHAVGKSSITVGIEGISRRLRSRLHKSLDDTKMHSGLKRILQSPIRELKLFFLATGYEEHADFDELRELLLFISETMRSVQRQPRIIISMTPLVRFPFTPLENEEAPDAMTVREIILQCERIVNAKKFEFRTAASMNDYSFSQIVVRAADNRIWTALCATLAQTGFVYYRDISDSFMAAFEEQLNAHGLMQRTLFEGIPDTKRLPVELDTDASFMESIRQSCDEYNDKGYCLGSERKSGACMGCNACSDDAQRSWMTAMRHPRPLKADQLKAALQLENRVVSVYVKCSIDADYRGVSRHLIAAEIARVFMAEGPLFTRLYRGYGGSLIAARFESEWIHGDELFTLNFQETALEKLMEVCGNDKFLQRINDAFSGKCSVMQVFMDLPECHHIKLHITTSWKCDPVGYLNDHALKYTFVRNNEGEMRYQFTKDALKKRMLGTMQFNRDSDESVIAITTGEKFRFEAFIRSVIALPTEKHIVRVNCSASIG